MACAGLETLTDQTITGILAFPTSCDYYFYAKVMFAFWLVLSAALFRGDKDRYLKSDYLSAMGVSAIATICVALAGTLVKIIQPDIFIDIFVVGMVFIVIWLIKK